MQLDKIRSLLYESFVEYPIVESVENQDISQAKALTIKSSIADFTKAVGIDPKLFFRIYHTLWEIIWNKDGTLTKFARTYNVKDFITLYKVMKDIKNQIKNDHLVPAWEVIRLMYMVSYPKLISKGLFTDPIHAANFVQRTIWLVLDDLNTLRKVFKIMQYMEQSEEFKQIMLSLEKKFDAGIKKDEQ